MIKSYAVLIPLFSAALLTFVVSSCKRNHPPDSPAVPTGPHICFKDTTYTFSTIATDPDGDSVRVGFAWTETSACGWSAWMASGDVATLAHAWLDTGTYEVRTWATDERELCSARSSALAVQVVLYSPPDWPRAPLGPKMGDEDSSYSFATTAFHPDYAGVSIRFAWGDGDTSDWSTYVPCSWPVRMSHAWSTSATYLVAAQARDPFNALSPWSDSTGIIIRPTDTLTKWRLQLAAGEETELFSSPAIGPDGTIYVGSSDGSLCAVNPDGTLRWRYLTGGSIRSSPAVAADGTVYVGSADGHMYAINPGGSLWWSYATNSNVECSPALAADGTVYFGSNDSCLYAVSPSGWLKWRCHTGDAVTSSPAVAADGTVYFGSNDKYVYALNPDSTLKWIYKTHGDIFYSSPAVGSDGTVYVGSKDNRLYALNPDGTLRWRYRTSGDVLSSPAIAPDGAILFGSHDGSLRALNADSTPRWRYSTGGKVQSSPALDSRGNVYFGSDDNCFYILNPDGTLRWQRLLGNNIRSSPTIGPDGTVYFTCDDGYLYALRGSGKLADSPWPKFHHDLRNSGRFGGGR